MIDNAADLRRGIDHIGAGVSFVIHDGKGRVLLQKRGQQARDEQGRWDTGGGAIEFGESFDDTLQREIREELSCDIVKAEFLTVYDAHREHEGRPTHWVQVIFAVQVDPAAVSIGEPHKIDELAWFTSKTLPSPLHSQFHKSYELALKQGIVR
jgi:8-oxo-dGTP pyrophosphatase MutT (NUDIX family)